MTKQNLTDIFDVENSSERFMILNEIYGLLKTKGIQPSNLIKSMLKSKGSIIGFKFSGVNILLERKTREKSFAGDFEFDFGEDAFEISLTATNGALTKTVSCKFRTTELERLMRICLDDDSAELENKRSDDWSSRFNKQKIGLAKNILQYLQMNNDEQPVSSVSKSLGVSNQNTLDAIFLLEMLDVVECFEQRRGKKTYRFVRLAKTKNQKKISV